MSDSNSSLLQKVNHEGNDLDVLHKFNIRAVGFTVDNSNDLLLCTGDFRIKQIRYGTDQVIDSIYNVYPFGAATIHITKDKVISGVRTDNEAAVIVTDLKGKQQAIYQHNSYRKPLLQFVWNATKTNNGNIFVVALDTANKSTVIVLGTVGKVINTYEGRRELNTIMLPFRCIGLARTPRDKIIVSDINNHLLHFLDSDGNYITHYNTQDIGILDPVSLAFSTDGQLYIGCSNLHMLYDGSGKAKLYEVNFYEY